LGKVSLCDSGDSGDSDQVAENGNQMVWGLGLECGTDESCVVSVTTIDDKRNREERVGVERRIKGM
jgi:hypothetical protein